jgi:hypothetical protein
MYVLHFIELEELLELTILLAVQEAGFVGYRRFGGSFSICFCRVSPSNVHTKAM